MKKLLSSILLICTLSLLLYACSGYEQGKTFSEDFLKSVSLEEMPKPSCENYAINTRTAGAESLKMEITLNDFEAYINSFIDYMSARDDIYYFGEQESDGLIAEMLPHRVTYEFDGAFEWENGINWYSFAYSLTGELGEASACSTHKQYTNPIIVRFEYDAEKEMAYVKISKNGTFGSSCIDESLSTPYVFKLDYYGNYYRIEGIRDDMVGEITLPETYKGLPVKEIGLWGFSANDGVGSTNGVTKLVIPDCYEKIGANAFDNMFGLTSVTIGNGVKEIGPGAFEGCKNLESVTFGNSLEAIYAEAFQYCEKLDNVVLPASLKEITYRAFSECKALKTIVIPRGVTKMLVDVFYENDSLTDIYCEIEAQPDGWNEEWCGNYREYLVNNDVRVTFGYGGDSPIVYYSVSFDTIGSYDPVFLENFSYLRIAGSEVTFYLNPIDGADNVAMYVNGVRHSVGAATEVPCEDGDGMKTLLKYTFTMPEGNAVISFHAEDIPQERS